MHNNIGDYFSYTVKAMELATKYEWKSVLRYDDEFRHLQSVYGFPWSYDSNHLHTVILEAKLPTSSTILQLVRPNSGGLQKEQLR